MTKSKSLSLASFQGTRPLSGTDIFLVFVSNGIPSGYPVIEPAAGFRMETILLAFVSFLPSSFKNPCLRNSRFIGLLYRKQERLYILPSFFVNTLSSFFLFFSGFFSSLGAPVPYPSEAERKIIYHTLSELSRYILSFIKKK